MNMAQGLYIKNPKAYKLAQQVSKRRGVTLTDAVIQALEEQVKKPKPIDPQEIARICAKARSLPILDRRSESEILGYDEFGIPTL